MKNIQSELFHLDHTLEKLRHYLPMQFPLKDFVHHNTLHAFQDRPFFDALTEATQTFGYKTRLSMEEYRLMYHKGEIHKDILYSVVHSYGKDGADTLMHQMLSAQFDEKFIGRIGGLRRLWKQLFNYNLDVVIHPILFRLLCNFLDQGIAISSYPFQNESFLNSIRLLDKESYFGFVRTRKAKQLLHDQNVTIVQLLDLLVAKESLYEQYLFDQQFSHPGWSGMVSVLEDHPERLLDSRKIRLAELIQLELILEIDALEDKFKSNWTPLGSRLVHLPEPLFKPAENSDYHLLLSLWQQALEWSYFDAVAYAIQQNVTTHPHVSSKAVSFQAVFCIDDRELSLRRYIELEDSKASTYSYPGFFGVPFYYQPVHGKFHMKLCPLPVHPQHLIKEVSGELLIENDLHFSHRTHGAFSGFLITHTIGIWSAIKLFFSIFFPQSSTIATSSFKHMQRDATLEITSDQHVMTEDGLRLGFTLEEKSGYVASLLKSIGLTSDFAPIVYIVGHGASSVNNTHYAGYDCGACSGRPGSVNARVFCHMANDADVRKLLETHHHLSIPHSTIFIGALHDTTRDEIEFYEDHFKDEGMENVHRRNKKIFGIALTRNAAERARRFETTDSTGDLQSIHERVKLRSVSLFEPRPELNHATNALCLIGRSTITDGLFFDRRAFMNSYDYRLDPEGDILFKILSAATPVCGGINLEYYFSRVDNSKLGAGSKLPHNVMGLVGVANGIDGDLRTGLPWQMVELHDPLRLLFVIEQRPEVVQSSIARSPALYEWYIHEWVLLLVLDPESQELYRFEKGTFHRYQPVMDQLNSIDADDDIIIKASGNLPVFQVRKKVTV